MDIKLGYKYRFVNETNPSDKNNGRIVKVIEPVVYKDHTGIEQKAYSCVDGLGFVGLAFSSELTEVFTVGSWVRVTQGKFAGETMRIEAVEDDVLTRAVNGGPMYRLVTKPRVGTPYLPGNLDDSRVVLPDTQFTLI
jgi:hypothetical protein